jgi:DNA-directed RNA polymerase II subunit RPB2
VGEKCVDNGKEINLACAVKAKTITSGLKYSLATGNWGQANMVGVRVGVLQVKFCFRYLCCLSLYHEIRSRYECILVVATILVYTFGR